MYSYKKIFYQTGFLMILCSCGSNYSPTIKENDCETRFIVISTDKVSVAVFSNISSRLNNHNNSKIKIDISAMINYLSDSPLEVMNRLSNLLSLADKYILPVIIEFDEID